MECTLELPWAPSVNHYKKIGRTIRTKRGQIFQQRVNSPETIAFYYQVFMKIKAKNIKFPDDAEFEVHIDLYAGHNRRYDADNFAKVTVDSLVRGGLIKDDSKIRRLVIEKFGMIQGGKIIVRIKEISCT